MSTYHAVRKWRAIFAQRNADYASAWARNYRDRRHPMALHWQERSRDLYAHARALLGIA